MTYDLWMDVSMFYEKTVLDNGVTVLTEPMDTVRSAAIGIWFSVGSRDEHPGEAGMSHFMEHMMFKGTPTRSAQDISEHFERLGAELNAFTGKEYTCYYARVLDEHVQDAVEVLSDMVGNALLADESIVPEREVVLEEIARHEDTPDDMVHELFASTMLPDHPLGLPVLGRRETVGAFDHDAAADFKARHYLTGNVVVAAAGNVSHAALVDIVKHSLVLPEGPRSQRVEATPVVEPRIQVLRKETEQAHICWGVAGLKARDEERFALSILDSVLGGGMASRLFVEIREKKGLAYAVYSYHTLYQDTGQFVVYAGTRPSNAEQVIRLIKTEIEKVAADGITAEELHRAKESMKGHLVLSLESTRARMTRLGKNEVTHGECLSIDELVERVEAVTSQDVSSLAGRMFGTGQILTMVAPFNTADMKHLL
ncbi:MAG: insulinase family protein [Coriobacteriia bacterium]|nr:insulinase family protein [Coriobacteriia bacterium]